MQGRPGHNQDKLDRNRDETHFNLSVFKSEAIALVGVANPPR